MLSEIRKYRVGLIGSHQFLDQLDDDTAAALAGNVGSRIVFQTGAEDGEKLSRLLSKYPEQVTPQDLIDLPKYTAVAQIPFVALLCRVERSPVRVGFAFGSILHRASAPIDRKPCVSVVRCIAHHVQRSPLSSSVDVENGRKYSVADASAKA